MNRTFKYRLFPNASQRRELERTLETHRRLYNRALDGAMLCWETERVRWTCYEQTRWFTRIRCGDPFLSAINSSSARQTLRKLDKAHAAFFRRIEQGKSAGHPRFKSADRFNEFAYPTVDGRGNGFTIRGNKLRLQHIGTVRVRLHREIPSSAKVKRLHVVRDGAKWFALFLIEAPDVETMAHASSVGIDVGLKSFVTTSDGEELGDSRTLERALPELRRRQRALNRCDRSSNRRKQVKQRVTSLHRKVRESRRDMHHKVSRSLVDRYGVIAAESLNIMGMLKNHRMARRISDAGWGQFIQILTSKAESAGCLVHLVDAKNTSQECSGCGEIVRKSLAVRVHKCECGCVLDRDVNAAINILGRAVPEGVKVGVA